jgi:hypothetical protein
MAEMAGAVGVPVVVKFAETFALLVPIVTVQVLPLELVQPDTQLAL